jgi:hypothetical protein
MLSRTGENFQKQVSEFLILLNFDRFDENPNIPPPSTLPLTSPQPGASPT